MASNVATELQGQGQGKCLPYRYCFEANTLKYSLPDK